MSLAIGIASAIRAARETQMYQQDMKDREENRRAQAEERQLRTMQIADARSERDKKAALEKDLAGASQPLVQQGTVVGAPGARSFARNEADVQMLNQHEADMADLNGGTAPEAQQGAAVGNKIFNSTEQAAKVAGPDGRTQRLARQSDVYAKHGRVAESEQLAKMAKEAQKEGDVEALEEIVRTRDPARAMALFNAKGKDRVSDVRIVEDPTQKSRAYGVPALKVFGKVNGSDQEIDLLQGSNVVDHLILVKGGAQGLMDAERTAKADARAETGHQANLEHMKFNEGMQTKTFAAGREDRKDDKAFRDKKFDWEKDSDLFSRQMQKSQLGISAGNLAISRDRLNMEKQQVEDSRKAAASQGLDLKKIDPQLNRIGDIIGQSNKVDESLPEPQRAKAAQDAAALKVRAQQVYIGAVLGGSSLTPEMAVDAALNGKFDKGEMVVNPATGQKAVRPVVIYQGRTIPLSHSALMPPPQEAAQVTPQQAARAPVPVNTQANPQAMQWVASVNALRESAQAIAKQIPSMPPEQQAAAGQQITQIGAAINSTIAKAREQGVVVP